MNFLHFRWKAEPEGRWFLLVHWHQQSWRFYRHYIAQRLQKLRVAISYCRTFAAFTKCLRWSLWSKSASGGLQKDAEETVGVCYPTLVVTLPEPVKGVMQLSLILSETLLFPEISAGSWNLKSPTLHLWCWQRAARWQEEMLPQLILCMCW